MQLYTALRRSEVPAARRKPANSEEPYSVTWTELGVYVMYHGIGPETQDERWANAELFADWEPVKPKDAVSQLGSLPES